MSGTGTVSVVDNVSDRDGTRVWRLSIDPSPGNADARRRLEVNRTVVSDIPAQLAVMMSQKRYPVCPLHKDDVVSWDAGHIYCVAHRYDKHGYEVDVGAPLSPP